MGTLIMQLKGRKKEVTNAEHPHGLVGLREGAF